jgi:putative addiction module component (TIGR02574 family)
MSQTVPIPPPGFDELTVDEQIEYVQLLWDRIAERPDDVPAVEWHSRVIAERLERYQDDPSHVVSWEEVRARVQKLLSDSR